jgi:hypothetical protein
MKQQFTGPISLDVAARTVTLHGIALPAERVLLAVNSTVGFIYHIHEHEPANISTVADATGGILSAVGYDAIGSFNGNLNIYQGGIDKGGIVHISGGVITIVNEGSGYTAGFANTVGGTRLVIAIDPSFSTVIHFAAYKDCDTHQNTDAVSVFYEDGVDLGKLIKDESDETQTLLQTEFDQTQTDLAAFRVEVKAESDETQALLQAEFDQTQTQLTPFQAEVKAENDETQTLLQTEFDDTRAQLTAFQAEVKADNDETQTLLQTEFDDTRTQLTAFQAEVKAENDETQTLLQTEFDATQVQLTAFQAEVKLESNETQTLLGARLPVPDPNAGSPVLNIPNSSYVILNSGPHGPTTIRHTSDGVSTLIQLSYNSGGDLTLIEPV